MRSCRFSKFAAALLATFALTHFAAAGERPATPPPRPAMKKAKDLIPTQDPPKITARLRDVITPDNSSVLISLSRQRAYLMVNGDTYIDTPISSGKRAGMTPSGSFHVMEKDKDHRSSVYGNFVDSKGRVVRAGISIRIDSAPSGTHYVGAPMLYFMRLTDEGVGMHIGILPGYPASHGCVRLPAEIAPLIYEKVKIGTPVTIQQ